MSDLVCKLRRRTHRARGLCSLLNSVLGLYEEQLLGDRKTIYVDDTNCPYFKCVRFFDVFETNEIITDSTTKKSEIIIEEHLRSFANKRYNPSLKPVLNFTPDFHQEIKTIISKLNLPKSFSCFHIRRGDKVGEKPSPGILNHGYIESKKFKFCDYLKRCENTETIFIMTDDYHSIQEAREHLKENNLPNKIIYLTDESQSGRSETLDIESNRAYTKQELVQFFAEMEIAKLSNVFVGTFSSNVYRYIMNTCTTVTEFVNIETK